MKRYAIVCAALLAQGCSGDDSGVTAGSQDGSTGETSTPGAPDSSATQEAAPDGASPVDAADAGRASDSTAGDDASDTNVDASEADGDAGSANTTDGACPAAWTAAPSVDPSIAVPADGGGVILHAAASGTQDYTCTQATVDGGSSYTWTFVGPEAELRDCNAVVIGHHLASDGGAAYPEWIETSDGTFVVGRKVAAFTPDGGAASVPWLLLQAVAHGGTGTLGDAQYIQRLNTDGGVAPTASACDQGSTGTTQKVPYTADYYFFGP